MITHLNTVDTGSITVRSGCTDEGNHHAIIIESGNTLRKYSLLTYTQVGSNISVTASPLAVTMINAASAFVAGTTSNWDVVELSSGYKTTHASGGFSLTTGTDGSKTQCMASDTSNQIVMTLPNSARTIVKFNGATQTFTTINLDSVSNDTLQAIIFIGSSRYIVATQGGHLYEIDDTGKIYKRYTYDRNPESVGTGSGNVSGVLNTVNLMYVDGFLHITGGITVAHVYQVIDWTTGVNLHKQSAAGAFNLLSKSASGIFLNSRGSDQVVSNSTLVYEQAAYLYGMCCTQATGEYFTNSPGHVGAVGLDSTNGRGWVFQDTIDDIRVFQVTPPFNPSSRVISVPGNSDFWLIMLDITDGPGRVRRLVDTYTTSPRTINIPSGRTILEIVGVNRGTSTTWDVSKYVS